MDKRIDWAAFHRAMKHARENSSNTNASIRTRIFVKTNVKHGLDTASKMIAFRLIFNLNNPQDESVQT